MTLFPRLVKAELPSGEAEQSSKGMGGWKFTEFGEGLWLTREARVLAPGGFASGRG